MTRRLTAPNVEISKNFSDHDDDPADNEVLVSIRSWGNAAFVFPDLAERADWRKPENTLWQARIFHTGRRSLGYMLLDAARAALRVHPDASMKTLEQLQQNHHVKLLSGGPPSSGDPDPDGMEFTPWQPVIYAAGESPMPILELLQYLVKHHCTCGHWRHTPPLAIRIQEWTWAAKPPPPWTLRCHPNMSDIACFRAVPPTTRQHILCQLNRAANRAGAYILTLFGNLYPYRRLLNNENIPAGQVPASGNEKKATYVRQMHFDHFDTSAKERIQSLLVNALCNLPIYFIDATEQDSDEFVFWMTRQKSVILAETHMCLNRPTRPLPAAAMPKRRFQAHEVTLQEPLAKRNNNNADPTAGRYLIATVTYWGSAAYYFNDTPTETKLWQVQVDHAGYNNFSYKILGIVNDTLRNYPDSNVTDLKSMEQHLKIRVLNGAPSQQGEDNDPDGMQFTPWRPVLYVGNDDLNPILDLIHRILKHKVDQAQILDMPVLQVQSNCAQWNPAQEDLPQPWQLLRTEPEWMPNIFKVLPPRGRRHIVCQLETAEDDHYNLMFLGGLYVLREQFDTQQIPYGFHKTADPTEKRIYVRLLKVNNSEDGKNKILRVVNNVLHHMPVYFYHYIEDKKDPMLTWLLSLGPFRLNPIPFDDT
ncbi:hypothetical protein AK812_SmicGene43285 [Symbiodinium microadriaticum]|uniref:Uncharacterized protein n=1 Tax=Symbiodinium microadriaticum TaxID=2951 RepID=A0A1Q9C1E5_SYMMI|nr:hypothetical protein AK812_SmicGene43285 [Symbiodinium microadriaticum]CAE7388806.1 unnamed protein product [Symbiodinium sp. KB8]CAE7879707.1 unnamed protein product [Symbiodinium microadriaticum]